MRTRKRKTTKLIGKKICIAAAVAILVILGWYMIPILPYIPPPPDLPPGGKMSRFPDFESTIELSKVDIIQVYRDDGHPIELFPNFDLINLIENINILARIDGIINTEGIPVNTTVVPIDREGERKMIVYFQGFIDGILDRLKVIEGITNGSIPVKMESGRPSPAGWLYHPVHLF